MNEEVLLSCGHEVRTNLKFVDGVFKAPRACNCRQCDVKQAPSESQEKGRGVTPGPVV